jgi:hypothetical protein
VSFDKPDVDFLVSDANFLLGAHHVVLPFVAVERDIRRNSISADFTTTTPELKLSVHTTSLQATSTL